MNYGHMNKEIERLKAEIEKLLNEAEQVDAGQDAALGSRRGDELPAELKRREERLAKIREAKARLEAEARAKAKEERRCRDEKQAKRVLDTQFTEDLAPLRQRRLVLRGIVSGIQSGNSNGIIGCWYVSPVAVQCQVTGCSSRSDDMTQGEPRTCPR